MCISYMKRSILFFFFFNDTATTEIYTLSLHDALPISLAAVQRLLTTLAPTQSHGPGCGRLLAPDGRYEHAPMTALALQDRKSTRLNSSHANISYAVFCLKKKKNTYHQYFTSMHSHRSL